MSQPDTNRNLLFAIIAVQMDFVPRDAMFSAMVAWTERKETPLAQILVDCGELSPGRRSALDVLIDEHIKAHSGDPARSLQALSSTDGVADLLTRVPDVQLQASLGHLRDLGRTPAASDEPGGIPTSVPATGEAPTRSPAAVGPDAAWTTPLAPWGNRFRVVRKHAEGGLGVVSVAIDDELDREVAYKEIKPRHADHRTSQARFVMEAEITGKLEHPGIVPIYGLGHDPLGRPYYAMRFIQGDSLAEAINRFHDPDGPYRDPGRRTLQLRELLGRFLDVCDALAYAHSRGVLHRDLKPGNVMLGPFGETLVVDWGLALNLKEIPGDLESTHAPLKTSKADTDSLPSEQGSIVGTLQYMPPEQAEGAIDQLGPRSDVYGLGAILYDLLTGRHPVTGTTQQELIEAVRQGNLIPLRQIRVDIPRPLEAICLKALSLRPEDRYATPRALASDIKSFLADEPVTAYREPLPDRFRRWSRRHRVLVSTLAATLIVGVLGLGSTLAVQRQKNQELSEKNGELTQANEAKDLQTQRAEEREKDAIDAIKKFRDVVVNQPVLKNSKELEALRKRLLQEPLAFFKSLRQRLLADNDSRQKSLASLAAAAFDLGALSDEIGDKHDALTAYREALGIYRDLVTQDATVTSYQSELAASYNSTGKLLGATGRTDEAIKALEQARLIRKMLAAGNPSVSAYQNELAASLNNLGVVLRATGKPDDALNASKQALEIRKTLATQYPAVTAYQNALAGSYNDVGVLLNDAGRPNEALGAFEQARDIQKTLAAQNPTITSYQHRLALNGNSIGSLLREMGKPGEALGAFEQARDILRTLATQYPTVSAYQNDLARIYYCLGLSLSATGKPDDALSAFEQAVEIRRTLVTQNPTVTAYQSDLARIYNHIGILLLAAGKPDDAVKSYGQAREMQSRLVADHPEIPEHFSELGITLNNLAVIDLNGGRLVKAREQFREAMLLQKRAVAAAPANSKYRQLLKNHLAKLQEVCQKLEDRDGGAEAERELKALADSDPAIIALDARLAAILKGAGKPRSAAEGLPLAQRAYDRSLHVLAARLWDEVLTAEPKLAVDRQAQVPYNAACAAALAGTGQGKDDPAPREAEQARLRGKASGWLRGELRVWEKVLDSGQAQARETVSQTLLHWTQDTDLAGVRESAALAKLPEVERKAWESLWKDVERLRAKAR